ncbi:anthranilate synthase component I [Natrononativus amylolyticus]|uniref:anthranilate synthase component I n=1 Tax=Natrononativus amylolyticus TaxID=2963434 RepID=UPI0020CDFBBA|nr:anthranilate synthase component I [Natrononativus amylolyticus]
MTDAAAETGVDRPELDISRQHFLELAAGAASDADVPLPEPAAEVRPTVVRAVATLEVETTPLDAYAALTGRSGPADEPSSPYSFLLESAEKTASSDPDGAFRPNAAQADRHARFSYVGYDPEAVVTIGPDGAAVEALTPAAPLESMSLDGASDADVLDVLRRALPDVRLENVPDHDRQHLEGGLVGFLAYDAVYDLWLEEVGCERPDSRFPDAQFVLTTKTLAFDERDGTVSLVFTPVIEADDDPAEVYDRLEREAERVRRRLEEAGPVETGGFVRRGETAGSREAYEESVRRAKEHVLDGDIYQGVISRRRELAGEIDPLGLYEALRAVNPSPYMYLLDHDDLTVVGASPETLVSVRGREVMANPIAGTCGRGASPVEDRRLAGEMLADGKERAEHTMLVDLARNDVRRVCEPGSVRVDEFMNVLKYSHVQHIESTVTGELAAETDAFDATRAAFPAGTLSGAPKVRAMEIIDELEAEPRGLYGGGVGYYSWSGDADFAIVIRTATVEADVDRGTGPVDEADRLITVRAGAGLVADSDPAAEYEETEQKMNGVLAALEALEADTTASEASR